jgi:hypothetical protein
MQTVSLFLFAIDSVFNWIQPIIAAIDQNTCYKNMGFEGKM